MNYRYDVSLREKGMKLLPFLKSKFPDGPSVKAIKRAIDGKGCRVNGKVETFSTHPLRAGDKVEVTFAVATATLPILTLYEDDSLKVCNKPAGVVSENKALGGLLVHRLDKDTSGVIVLAKTKAMQEKMKDLFFKREVEKVYLAIVDDIFRKMEGTVDNFLTKKHSYEGQSVWGSYAKGLSAITQWKCLQNSKEAALVECRPQTGRTHQIRVHMSEMGHPILGDHQYGKTFRCAYPAKRHMLHAYSVSFVHPISNKKVTVKASLPQDFQDALKTLRMEFVP